ncbi:MAG: alpha/beta hydrolase family protein [Candidatus Sumerlaeaceae bacterium]
MSIRMMLGIRGAVLASALVCAAVSPTSSPAQGILGAFLGLGVQQGAGSFQAPSGCPVMVEHFLPKCASAPAVIFLHGSDGAYRHARSYRMVCRALASEGYAVFFVHYFEGTPGLQAPDADTRELPDPRAFAAWLGVNAAAVNYVQNFGCGVDPNRIGVAGLSLGGYLATALASKDPRIRAVVTTSGGIPPQFANFRHMPPTLIIHGECDPTVPVAEAHKLHILMWKKKLCNELLILPGEGHVPFGEGGQKAAAERGLDFLNRNL